MARIHANVHDLVEVRQALQRLGQRVEIINNYFFGDGEPPEPPELPPQQISRSVRYWTYRLNHSENFSGEISSKRVVHLHRVASVPKNYTHLDLWVCSFEGHQSEVNAQWIIRPTKRWYGWYKVGEPPAYPQWDHDEFDGDGMPLYQHALHRWKDEHVQEGTNIIVPNSGVQGSGPGDAAPNVGDFAGYPINASEPDSLVLTVEFTRPIGGWPSQVCYKQWLVGRYAVNAVLGQFGELCGAG